MRLGIILEGTACWTINEKEHLVGPGEVIVVLPASYRSARACSPFRQVSAQIRSAHGEQHRTLTSVNDLPEWLLLPARVSVGMEVAAELISLLRHANAETELRQPGFAEMVDAYLRQFIIRLYRYAWKRSGSEENTVAYDEPGGLPAYTTPVNRALHYIHLHLNQPILITDVAAACGYSESHLRRLFREHVGMTPGEYMTRARIRRAQRLLQTGQFTVSEVAAEVGFSDPHHFSRTFKTWVGTAPRDFSKHHDS